MGFLSSILGVLSPRKETPDSAQQKKAPQGPSEVVSFSEDVIDEVVKTLSPLTLKDDFKGIRLRVADPVYFEMMSDDSFKERLRLSLANAQFASLAQGLIDIVQEVPGDTDAALCSGKVGFSFIRQEPVTGPAHGKASVAIAAGKGSLEKKSYVLDSSSKAVWHIGRGHESHKSGFRVNDIVIRDDEKDETLLELNSYVSSSQADILWREGRFYLKAMASGCRKMGGAATRIVRDEIVNEITDDRSLHLLKDGDVIELGKSVMLLFNLVK